MSWSSEIIIFNQPVSKKDKRSLYAKEILLTALRKTEKQYGSAVLKHTPVKNEERAKSLIVRKNYGDIIVGATRRSWERELICIKVPILKGLMGMRVLLINKDQQQKYSNITTLSALKEKNLGAGDTWAITHIFKQTGFKVVTSSQYESLFKMLNKKRFDFFPRGINEVLDEHRVRKVEYPNLHIEESILLKVPLPVYFFANPRKPKLAERVITGLNLMIADGTFDDIFDNHYKTELKQLNLDKRKVFVVSPPLSPN